MDAFYASVEQRDRPELRGRPLAVGGQPDKRGVVAAASYEARAFGVRSAIPMAQAVRLCPSLVIVSPDFQKYRAVSQQVFALFRAVTPLVEPLSLDEAYLDVTENAWGETLGMTVARRLKAEIKSVTGLTASAGVAPNKFLAKIASGWQKPDGLTVIAPERVEPFLRSLPVDALWGVGPVTARKLRERGIEKLDRCALGRPRTPARGGRLARRLAAEALSRHRRSARHLRARNQVVRQREHVRARPDQPRRDSAGGSGHGSELGVMAGATRALRTHGGDQGAVQRLHHHHAQSHRDSDTRRVVHRRAAPSRFWTRRTQASGRFASSGVSVHNLCDSPVVATVSEARGRAPRLPFED